MHIEQLLAHYRECDGSELSPEIRELIIKLHNEPTPENWRNARLILMRKHVTSLWDLVCKVDARFATDSPDCKPPDAFTLLRALKL